MLARVHHDLCPGDKEQQVVAVEGPCPDPGGLPQATQLAAQRVLMRLHVHKAREVNEEAISGLNTRHHPLDGESAGGVRSDVADRTPGLWARCDVPSTKVDEAVTFVRLLAPPRTRFWQGLRRGRCLGHNRGGGLERWG